MGELFNSHKFFPEHSFFQVSRPKETDGQKNVMRRRPSIRTAAYAWIMRKN